MSDKELVKRLRGRTTKKLFNDWHVGRDCPECGSMADRPKCLLDYGPSCPRHDPDAYDPPAWDHVADKDCAEAADRIEALEQHVADLLADVPCACGYDNPTDVCMKHLPLVRNLTEQLEAARADAKEAEAYAEELEAKNGNLCDLAVNEHGRAERAEAKLSKAVKALLLARVHVANNEQGWSVGRASARSDLKIINATLAGIEGSNAP